MADWILVALVAVLVGKELMDRDEKRILKKILEALAEIESTLQVILKRLFGARSATITFTNERGEPIMPARIVVGGAGAKAVFTEFDGPNGTGNVVPPSGPITFASDNLAVATVDASGNVTAVAANPDGSDATANISGLDPASANKVTASDVITVGAAAPPPPPVAQSATLVLTAN